MSYYAEEMNPLGKWVPVKYADKPVLDQKSGRRKLASGDVGQPIRNIMEIPKRLQGKPLKKLKRKLHA